MIETVSLGPSRAESGRPPTPEQQTQAALAARVRAHATRVVERLIQQKRHPRYPLATSLPPKDTPEHTWLAAADACIPNLRRAWVMRYDALRRPAEGQLEDLATATRWHEIGEGLAMGEDGILVIFRTARAFDPAATFADLPDAKQHRLNQLCTIAPLPEDQPLHIIGPATDEDIVPLDTVRMDEDSGLGYSAKATDWTIYFDGISMGRPTPYIPTTTR